MAGLASTVLTIVLVHGGFVDGAGWEAVYKNLKKDGYKVSVVQNHTRSLEDDIVATRRVLADLPGPVLLVGHSYGGVIISEVGNDPKVKGLVYVAAFAPDESESVASLIGNPVKGAPLPPILPQQDGFLLLDPKRFPASFAADLPQDKANFLAASQVPWGVAALTGRVSTPAWKYRPSWYMVTTQDQMIAPELQRSMARRAGSSKVEVAGSHAIYMSRPELVADLIRKAASGTAAYYVQLRRVPRTPYFPDLD